MHDNLIGLLWCVSILLSSIFLLTKATNNIGTLIPNFQSVRCPRWLAVIARTRPWLVPAIAANCDCSYPKIMISHIIYALGFPRLVSEAKLSENTNLSVTERVTLTQLSDSLSHRGNEMSSN